VAFFNFPPLIVQQKRRLKELPLFLGMAKVRQKQIHQKKYVKFFSGMWENKNPPRKTGGIEIAINYPSFFSFLRFICVQILSNAVSNDS
jgi:hypothetical protein